MEWYARREKAWSTPSDSTVAKYQTLQKENYRVWLGITKEKYSRCEEKENYEVWA